MSQTKTEKTEREAFKKGQTGLDATLIEQWIAEHYAGPQDILGKEGWLAQLTKAVVERALSAELTHHLGYAPGGAPAEARGNCRNGTSAKTLLGEGGPVEIAMPRDRHSRRYPELCVWVGFMFYRGSVAQGGEINCSPYFNAN